MNLSVVIPAYNEEQNIKLTIQELLSAIKKVKDIGKVQIIVVDDHSSDNTFNIVNNINNSSIYCIRLSRRNGSHTALRAGFRDATGDAVLFVSADGQDNPECLQGMLKKWRNGARVIWALRKNRSGETLYIRKTAQVFYKILIWLGNAGESNIDMSRANFCLLDKIVVDAVNGCSEHHTSLFGLILWLGFNQDFVEYERRIRKFGKSKWNFRSHLRLAKDWFVGFCGLPLTIMYVIGIIVTVLGLLYAINVMIKIIVGKPVENWSLIMLVILLLGGMQTIMWGIIGEYLWRNLDESRKRPLFLIEKRSDTLKSL